GGGRRRERGERGGQGGGQGGRPPRQRQGQGQGGQDRRGGGSARQAPAPVNSAMADALRRAGLTDPNQGGRKR
ncbi:hypothetical protein, partial [Streptomyces atratus]